MTVTPIFTTEPMATRALAAEIRHAHAGLVQLLESRGGHAAFGTLRDVRCEADERIDILLKFSRVDDEMYRLGIEAKFDHELTRDQIERELSIVEKLFVLVSGKDAVPTWLEADYPDVSVISWEETLATFPGSRLTPQDIASIRLSKTKIDAILRRLDLGSSLAGWWVDVARNGNGSPSIVIYSPKLPDGRSLRGQIQVTGRGTPELLDDVRFEAFFGIEVDLTDEHYPDPETSDVVPAWIQSLQALHDEVIGGDEERLLISRSASGTSRKQLGRHKRALAQAYLAPATHLAKGYVDWALGPKTKDVTVKQLPELAAITVEVFTRWFAVEARRLSGGVV